MQEGRPGYFEAALSDFVFDVAAGGAIRHLVDRGYSVEQIMNTLDYPVPRAKVGKAVYRYMTESGILLDRLPEESAHMKVSLLKERVREKMPQTLVSCIEKYGEENVYMECPFGQWKRNNEQKLKQVISCLTSREQEYIVGIPWGKEVMYHRVNSRMREIAVKLLLHTDEEWRFYLKIPLE